MMSRTSRSNSATPGRDLCPYRALVDRATVEGTVVIAQVGIKSDEAGSKLWLGRLTR
jgi:hypothetical protein